MSTSKRYRDFLADVPLSGGLSISDPVDVECFFNAETFRFNSVSSSWEPMYSGMVALLFYGGRQVLDCFLKGRRAAGGVLWG